MVEIMRGSPLPDRIRALEALEREASGCMACELSKTRSKVVFGSGSPRSPLLLVGEGPGEREDLSGLPFVGRSGKLLDRLLGEELGISRDQIYIANIVKCRPPGNRNPLPTEVQACTPYLAAQIELIAPDLIVALGAVAARFLVAPSLAISTARGRFFNSPFGVVMPMFHPSYGLRQGASAVTAMRADIVTAKLYLIEKGSWPAIGS